MIRFYVQEAQRCDMRWACILLVTAALLLIASPAAAEVTLTINATPQQAHIGDTVTISGTVNGTPTIAVYLFLTGPELDPRGVTLENLNIPTGRGLFTTAPVQLSDHNWTYSWDTSVILGTLKPGKYTLYVLDSPTDRLRFVRADYATTDIEFLPSDNPMTETPLDPLLAVVAVGLTAAGICLAGRLHKR
jgi:hypothetical protein